MAGDLQQWVDAVRDYALDYISWLLRVASHPSYAAELANSFAIPKSSARTKIPVYILFCILVGATVGLLIPNRPPMKDRVQVAVTVSLLWLFISLLVHFFCRLMQGTGTVTGTLVTMIQVLAVVYVISYFITLLICSASTVLPSVHFQLTKLGYVRSGDILLTLQFMMLLVYVPLSVGSVHGFRSIRRVVIGLTAAACASGLGSLVLAMGGC
jgi:hypothetical protein